MDPERLTGFVYPVKKNGVRVRGRWQLWVNPPPERAFARDGQPVLDAKGRQKSRYPKTTRVVEAKGKKSAERRLVTWIAESRIETWATSNQCPASTPKTTATATSAANAARTHISTPKRNDFVERAQTMPIANSITGGRSTLSDPSPSWPTVTPDNNRTGLAEEGEELLAPRERERTVPPSFPLSIYSAGGGLRQVPGRAA
jgi:hypothetical protein